jgi:GNAT superfamily N-acetyltransferase
MISRYSCAVTDTAESFAPDRASRQGAVPNDLDTMSRMPDLVEFLPREASRDEWGRYHAFRRLEQAEFRPDEPLAPDDVLEAREKRPDPFNWSRSFHVVDGDVVVAELEAEGPRPESPEYATNRHLLWASGYVLQAHRRRGIALRMVPRALELLDEYGATVLSSFAEDDTGHGLLRRLGGEPRMVERQSRLDLRELDWNMVARWNAESEAAAEGARLELHTPWVPDDLLDEYCDAMNELMNTMPFEGLDHGDIVMSPAGVREWRERMRLTGTVNPTCLVRDADGSIVGMTDTVKSEYEPGIVRQNFTGVHPRARGRGLGKWLKAAMLEHVRQAHPDTIWISTENVGSNAPMLSINQALGFRLHRTFTYYQVSRETLRRNI